MSIDWRPKTKKFWFSAISLLFLLVGLIATLILVQKRQLLEKMAAGENASLTLPSEISANPGDTFNVPIMLDTDGAEIVGIDIVLDFSASKEKISLIDIHPDAQTSTTLKLFAPIDIDSQFDVLKVINQANTSGKVEFGAVAFDLQGETITTPFSGILGITNPLATLIFQVNGNITPPDQATITIEHTLGQTTDSNIAAADSGNDILANANSLIVTIAEPQPTITLTPTPTPGVTLTPTPTPTPEPTKAQMNFKVKFWGVNSQRPDAKVKIILAKNNTIIETFENINVSADETGIYTGRIMNITPDTYNIFIKGWAHLQKKLENIVLVEGENEKDWSGIILQAGDADQSNRVDSLDFALLVGHYIPNTPANSPADFDLNGKVNSLDFVALIRNYYQTGESP